MLPAANVELLPSLSLLSLSGPAALALAGFLLSRERSSVRIRSLSMKVTGFNLLIASLTAALAVAAGAVDSPMLGTEHVGFAARVDGLSATLFLLIGFVGLLVVRYALSYLERDPGQARFLSGLLLTLAAVSLLVLSGTLVQLMVGWVATSAGLHRMLLFYEERDAARIAAKKKFIVARVGDLLLVTACFLLVEQYATTRISDILELSALAANGEGPSPSVSVAALLLAVAAALKSAQFPTHGWLLEVMETPTPVSALLHAGIINAGGFLILRFANLFVLESASLDILAAVGAVTAIFGSLAMLCQSSVKVSLAYSTVGQMGFMLLECGLGAFGAALVHLVAHSLYKAHAFLASGSTVTAMAPLGPRLRAASPLRIVVGLATGAGVVAAVATYGGQASPALGLTVLLAVLSLALGHYLIAATSEGGVLAALRALLTSIAMAGLFVALHRLGDSLLAGFVVETEVGPIALGIGLGAVAIFGALVVAQAALSPEPGTSPLAQRIYVAMKHGLHANTLMSRWVGAWRRPTSLPITHRH